jgi:hypothetical protein
MIAKRGFLPYPKSTAVSGSFLKKAIFALILITFGSFLISQITLPSALDLPRQMKNGQMVLHGDLSVLNKNVYSYTEPEHQFANHHWLSGVVYYVMYLAVGWDGMVVIKILVYLAFLALLLWFTARDTDMYLAALFAIPAIGILIGRTALRPEMFSYLFVVVFLVVLLDAVKRPERNRLYWLVLIELVWVNMHLFFPIGVMLTAGVLIEQIILNWGRLRENIAIKKLSLLLIALCIVMFINPFGLGNIWFSLRVNSDPAFPIHSAEINTISDILKGDPGWETPAAHVFNFVVLLTVLSFAIAIAYRVKKKQPIFSRHLILYAAACLGSAILGYYVIRGLPLFGLMFLPAIANNLFEPFLALKSWVARTFPQSKRLIARGAIALLFVLCGAVIGFGQHRIVSRDDQGLGLAKYSEDSINFFKKHNLHGPIFNDTDIGSFLIYELYPQEKVFTDNRFGDAYSGDFFKETYLPMLADEAKWLTALEKYQFNVIMFYHYDAVSGARDFLWRRFHDQGWALVYADSYVLTFVRNTKENEKLIAELGINENNLPDKLAFLTNSSSSHDMIAGADIFNLFGRFDLSAPVYMKFVSLWPQRGKVWMVMGRTELMRSDQGNSNPFLAALYLEKAIDEGWKTWESYSFLALAYYRTEQYDRARWAVNKELALDPGNEDGQKWLGILANVPQQK